MKAVQVPVQRLEHGRDLALPAYATPGSAGVDLVAALTAPLTLAPGARAAIPTGLALALPDGWEAQVRPRSGFALSDGVTVLNAPGTVDADYRGEVKVILINLGDRPVTIERGRRIAQLVIAPVAQLQWQEMAALPGSTRGARGFGSTGQ
jgi:dUTP pyrophosphatase